MAFSVSPSVIVREVDASTTVPAIATAPAAIAGVFRWGPVGEAILVSSENELAGRFGKPNNDNYETFFTAADYLSYANALFVSRVDNGSTKSEGTDYVLFTAETAYANTEADGYVAGVTAGSVGAVDSSNTTWGVFDALYTGALGNELDVVYADSTAFEADLLAVGDIPATYIAGVDSAELETKNEIQFAATSFSFQFPAFTGADANDQLDALTVGDLIVIGNDSVGFQELPVTAISHTVQSTNGTVLVGPDAANNTIAVAREYAVTVGSKFTLSSGDLSTMNVGKKWANASLFGANPQAGNYHVAVVDRAGVISGEVGGVLEMFTDLSPIASSTRADGSTNYIVNVIETDSDFITVANTSPLTTGVTVTETLSGGTDGTSETVTTLQALAEGYDLFANPNEIDVSFILQGKGDALGTRANYIISNVVDNRKDAVLFVSPSYEASVAENKTNGKMTKTIAYRNLLQNSSYWFMDSGYKYRYDKYNDVYRWVPMNGDMAGLASRVEPFESPAGFRKGVIKNVVKLAFNPSKAQRDQLYSADINPVMSQVGQGVVLFGDKTGLGLTSAFDRINVRRLFISVEKAIANAAQSFLFELNDEFSQTQFKNIVEPFLREIQGRRGIIDFRVISDTTVNTPAVIDQGKFRANIFIKPARSINVIELTFVATRTGIEFEEIVGSIS